MEDDKMTNEYDPNPRDIDPVEKDGFTVEMKRRDPFGMIYLVYNGNELEDKGMFTTVDAAKTTALLFIEDLKTVLADIEPKKVRKVA